LGESRRKINLLGLLLAVQGRASLLSSLSSYYLQCKKFSLPVTLSLNLAEVAFEVTPVVRVYEVDSV
jgi:hypothetical protein